MGLPSIFRVIGYKKWLPCVASIASDPNIGVSAGCHYRASVLKGPAIGHHLTFTRPDGRRRNAKDQATPHLRSDHPRNMTPEANVTHQNMLDCWPSLHHATNLAIGPHCISKRHHQSWLLSFNRRFPFPAPTLI